MLQYYVIQINKCRKNKEAMFVLPSVCFPILVEFVNLRVQKLPKRHPNLYSELHHFTKNKQLFLCI